MSKKKKSDMSALPAIKSDLEMMTLIAEDKQTFEEVKLLTSNRVTDQIKVFLVAEARNELSRVVKLTKFLDRLEDSFISKADKAMGSGSLTLKQYGSIIDSITTLLSRSNEIIYRVLKDDSLMTVLNTTIYASKDATTTSIVTQLKDAQSRERVRLVLQQVINKSNEYVESTVDADVKEIIVEENEKDVRNTESDISQ